MAPAAHYDFLVIGGGSGGVAAARRAAQYGAKTMLVESNRLGGTCVNVGCVPKKVMWNASDLAVRINKHAKPYCLEVPTPVTFDWPKFKAKRDAYVERLNNIYANNLKREKVDFVFGKADITGKNAVSVALNDGSSANYTADHILIAVGGTPVHPKSPKGAELGIDSNGFFELEKQPSSVALIGAGYIGVELAGMFHGLGTETHLFIRGNVVLRKFDDMISHGITDAYDKIGINVHRRFEFQGDIERVGNQIKLTYTDAENTTKTSVLVDKLVWCVGRQTVTYDLSLSEVGIKTNELGKIVVDEYQNTSVPNVYALGDDTDAVELTPTAIAAGRKLGDRLFGGVANAKLDYTNIPSAVFSHPEAGTAGLSESAAIEKYGKENIKVYKSEFINMYFSPMEPEEKMQTKYKLVCEGKNEKVVGIHLVGESSAEILQGFGVALKMGATKADFDSCVAIHPTAAEELVTLK